MNLMKFLTVGQSLKQGKIVLGKYKLQQSLLPKFASTVRPSAKSVMKTPASSVEPAMLLSNESAELTCPAEPKITEHSTMFAPRALEKTQKIPSGRILRRFEDPVTTVLEPGPALRFVLWLETKVNALHKKLFPVRSKKKSGQAPVQTEWSLEKVTVLRNDLTEADLEIIAPKASANIETRKTNRPDMSRVKDSGKKWIKKTTGLFKTSSPFEAAPMETQPEPENAELAGRS